MVATHSDQKQSATPPSDPYRMEQKFESPHHLRHFPCPLRSLALAQEGQVHVAHIMIR